MKYVSGRIVRGIYTWLGWSGEVAEPIRSSVPVWAAGYSLQPRHYYSLPASNFQPTATQERSDQCGNQHYSRELLMMGIVVPETC